MRHVISSREILTSMIFLFTLISALGLPASTEESGGARDIVVVPRGLLDGCGRDDPFAPLVAKTTATPPARETANGPLESEDQRTDLPPLYLQGIVWSHKLPLAIINDTVVGVGDNLEGRTIVSIERHKVIVEVDGERRTLQIEIPTLDITTGPASAKE